MIDKILRAASASVLLLALLATQALPAIASSAAGGQSQQGAERWVNVRTALTMCHGRTPSRQPIHVYGYFVFYPWSKYDLFGELFATWVPDTILTHHKPYVSSGLSTGVEPGAGVLNDKWGWIDGTLDCGRGHSPSLDAAGQTRS